MLNKTEFTKRTGISLPLIQAPMAGVTTPELVAAVSNAGGLGSLGAALMQPDELRKTIHRIRELTQRPFNVNLFIPSPHQREPIVYEPFLQHLKQYESELGFGVSRELSPPPPFEKQIEVLLQEKVPIFSFTFGIPPLSILQDFQKRNILVIGTATHVKEALALQEAGVDFIVVQGKEAGGHRGTFLEDSLLPTLQLIKEIRSHVKKPLIAAGGIMEKKDILAALNAGAAAVQMGTAFITCAESSAHPAYKKALLEWKGRNTVLTKAFTGKEARAIENRFTQEIGDVEIPPFPIAQSLTGPMRKAATAAHNPEFMSLWAGEKFRFCHSGTAQELIRALWSLDQGTDH